MNNNEETIYKLLLEAADLLFSGNHIGAYARTSLALKKLDLLKMNETGNEADNT